MADGDGGGQVPPDQAGARDEKEVQVFLRGQPVVDVRHGLVNDLSVSLFNQINRQRFENFEHPGDSHAIIGHYTPKRKTTMRNKIFLVTVSRKQSN